jgi:hypothetical protein
MRRHRGARAAAAVASHSGPPLAFGPGGPGEPRGQAQRPHRSQRRCRPEAVAEQAPSHRSSATHARSGQERMPSPGGRAPGGPGLGSPPHPLGAYQTAPRWSRSFGKCGAPPRPPRRGPDGHGLRDGKPRAHEDTRTVMQRQPIVDTLGRTATR